MTTHRAFRLTGIVYRCSLRLLPRRFYAEYADQMAFDFDDLLHDACLRAGRFRIVAVTLRAFADLFLSAIREWLATTRGAAEVGLVTPAARRALDIAGSEAGQFGLDADIARLFIGLSSEQYGVAGAVLRESGMIPDRLRASLLEARGLGEPTAAASSGAGQTAVFDGYMKEAAECARSVGHGYIGTEHLALSLLAEPSGDAARILRGLGIEPDALRNRLREHVASLSPGRPYLKSLFAKGVVMLILCAAAALVTSVLVIAATPAEGDRDDSPSTKTPTSHEIAIARSSGADLQGTLVLPSSHERAAAILVIPGAGPFDRDAPREAGGGSIAGDALGKYLAQQGFVVLRLRGGGGTTGNAEEPSVDQLADDALRCVEYLQRHERVKPDRVGVLGQSAGGLVAMAAAANSEKVAFLVTAATPIVPIDSIAGDLLDGVLRSFGVDDAERSAIVARFAKVLTSVAEGEEEGEIRRELVSVLGQVFERMPEEQRARSGKQLEQLVESAASRQLETFSSPWFKSLLRRDPAKMLAKTTCPVLVLFAGKDVKVAADKNSNVASAALKDRSVDNWEVRTIDDATHSFEASPADSRQKAVAFSPQFLEVLSTWLKKVDRTE